MITIKRRDMFAEEVDALVGAGLAVEFKKRWPEYFDDYLWASTESSW
jgi:hypothetical protein